MASLDVGTLNMTITADGSAAIAEFERVRGAADGAAQDLERLGDGGELAGIGESAGEAAEGLEQMGGAADEGARGVEKAEAAAKKADVSMQKLGESLSKAGQKMTTFVTVPIVAALTASVKGASDLTETLGKTEVVFGQMSDRVLEWSGNSIQAMGLAQGSALEYASTYGDMATGMGLAIDKSAEMSMKLTQLAADLASFKNISTDLAAQKLNAVFTGEAEGLKSLGIVMTQTNLEAFALSRGITQSVSSMSQAEQVMLRYQYVMEATKNAQGDFARTGESLANQTRKLGETVKELGEGFGSRLIPVVTPVVAGAQRLAQSFAELDGSAKNTIIAVAGVAAAIGPLLLLGGKLLTGIAAVKAALTALSINPIVLGLAGIAAAVAGVVALKGALDSANAEVDRTSESYQRMRAAVERPVKGRVDVEVNDGDAAETLDALDGKRATATVDVKSGETGGLDAAQAVEELPKTKTTTVTVTTNGAEALAAAKASMEALEGDGHFGSVTVTGNTGPIDTDISDLRTSLSGLDAEVTVTGNTVDIDAEIAAIRKGLNDLDKKITITADGSAVISEDGSGIIKDIQDKIDGLQAVIPLVADETKRAALESQLTALQTQLGKLQAGASVTVTYTESDDATANAKAFADAVAKLPNGDTYSATGEFEIAEGSEEDMKAYTEALAAATDAVTGYSEAVDALHDATDKIYDEQVAQVFAQQGEELAKLNAAYNEGTIEWDDYVKGTQDARDAAKEQIAAIEAEREEAKKLADMLKNGTAEDDAETQARLTNKLNPNATLTPEMVNDAMSRVNAAYQAGEQDPTNAAIVRSEAVEAAAGQYETLANAVTAYYQTVAEAEAATAAADAAYQSESESLDKIAGAVKEYQTLMSSGMSGKEAMSLIDTEGWDPSQVEAFTAAVTNADGELMNYRESLTAMADVDDLRAQSEERHTQALEQAQQAQADATAALQAQTEAAANASIVGDTENATAALQGMVTALDATGASMDASGQAMILGAQSTAEGMAAALASGDIEGALSKWSETGENMIAGLTGSLEDTSAVEAAGKGQGDAAVDGVNEGAGTASPSTKTRQTGENMIAGMVQGLSRTAPVETAARNMSTRAVQAAANAAKGTDSIGSSLISGAVSGVNSAAGRLAQAAAKAVRDAIAAAKQAAEIQSPSRVMKREVGAQLVAGTVSGVESETNRLLPRVRQATEKLMSGAIHVARTENYTVAGGPGLPIDYNAMGAAMQSAMGRVRFGFSVGDRDLAQATMSANARAVNARARQISRGYGGTA